MLVSVHNQSNLQGSPPRWYGDARRMLAAGSSATFAAAAAGTIFHKYAAGTSSGTFFEAISKEMNAYSNGAVIWKLTSYKVVATVTLNF